MSRNYDYHKPRARHALRHEAQRRRNFITLMLTGGGTVVTVLVYLILAK